MLTVGPRAASVSRDSGTLFTGFTPVESTHSGEAFNPCPLPAPCLRSSPLYMDMFYFHSSFLLAALSAAQQGTNSLLIGTYLGSGRNPIFLSEPYSLPLSSSCPVLLVSNSQASIYYSFFFSPAGLSLIPPVSPSEMDGRKENVTILF